MARLTGSYFCRSIFLPVLPDGCLVSIFPSVIVLFLWIFLFQTGTNAAEPHKNAFGAAVVNYHRCGLNCNLFNADFSASSAERADPDCSCQPTSIPVRSAARTSKRSSQCATNRSANARNIFAGCQNGDTVRLNVYSAPAQA